MNSRDEALHDGSDTYEFGCQGLVVRIDVAGAVSKYHATFTTAGGQFATVYSDTLPRPKQGLLLRGDGMWADHECETPYEHWSVGLEAFAVVTAELPVGGLSEIRGDLTPMGLDLEWTTSGEVDMNPNGYFMPCVVVGEILYGVDAIDIDCVGWRSHSWRSA